MTRWVLFLDIDGVLAPIPDAYRYGDVDPVCMDVLNEIVARSGAHIVVSSTWRFGKSVDELQKLLEDVGFRGRVLDKTSTEARGLSRGEEIAAWLEEHPVDGWVILDDHGDMGTLREYLVQTESGVGLQPAHAERVLAVLGAIATADLDPEPR